MEHRPDDHQAAPSPKEPATQETLLSASAARQIVAGLVSSFGCDPSEVVGMYDPAGQLISLYIRCVRSIQEVPPEIARLTTLRSLLITGQWRLSRLPEEIGSLSYLEHLEIRDCALSAVPAAIGQLQRLRVLNLFHNQLEELPGALFRVSQLRTLDVTYNQLHALPSEIGQLSQLEVLRLGSNQLSTLPSEIGQLERLLSLELNHNQLSALPPATGQLARLEFLQLQHNRLSALPPELTYLTRLHPLQLEGNPLGELSEDLQRLTRIHFEVEPYQDTTGQGVEPQRVLYEEAQIEEGQFGLVGAGDDIQPPELPQHVPDRIQLSSLWIILQSAVRQHFAWVRLEYWEQEPPLPPRAWEPVGERWFAPGQSGAVQLWERTRGKCGHPFSLGADRYYHLRVASRGHSEVQTAVGEDSRPPRGIERYVLQFWPRDPVKEPYTVRSSASLSTQPPQAANKPPPPSADGEVMTQMAERLGFDMNELRCEYDSAGRLTSLNIGEKLSLSAFPPDLWRLTQLRSLSISGQKLLTELPPEIGQLTALENLNLSQNHLASLPLEIGQLTALTSLSVDHNQLRTLPSEISQLTQLQRLYLHQNQLRTLPLSIGRLTKLVELWLNQNQLSSLPPEMGQLNHLRHLDLSGNQLDRLPSEMGQLAHLERLNLSQNRLVSLPAEMGLLTHLAQLKARENIVLEHLPAEIGGLTRLTDLDLSINSLTTLPRTVGQLTRLWLLSLTGNQLKALHREIGRLSRLFRLTVDYNQLGEVPEEIGGLATLSELDLSHNQLTHLPPEIAHLTRLSYLNLASNRLTQLPPEIGQMAGLHMLVLDHNQLSTLPEELASLPLSQIAVDDPLTANLPEALLQVKKKSAEPIEPLFFKVEDYHDAAGRPLHPLHLVYDEVRVDYSQFVLRDNLGHLRPEPAGAGADRIHMDDGCLYFTSSAQYHDALVRMEVWEQEPPMPPGQWETTGEVTIAPHSGFVSLRGLMGRSSPAPEVTLGEPGRKYRLRAVCRNRSAARAARWKGDHPPQGIEQYVLQFWPAEDA